MKQMIYIGPQMDERDPKKGQKVFVYNEINDLGFPMVQILNHPSGQSEKVSFYPLTAFREPLDHGDTLINELAKKVSYIEDDRFPKLQRDEIKKEEYLRKIR